MKLYRQLIGAIAERLAALPASLVGSRGRLVYKDVAAAPLANKGQRPFMDDGTTVDQVMLEKHLPQARQDTPVQPNEGGTGQTNFAGQAGNVLVVNPGETGYQFQSLGAGSSLYPTIGPGGDYLTLTAALAAIPGTHPVGQKFTVIGPTVEPGPITLTDRIQLEGSGRDSIIQGNITFDTGSDDTGIHNVNFDGDITVNPGVNGLLLTNNWMQSGHTFSENSGNQCDNAYLILEDL